MTLKADLDRRAKMLLEATANSEVEMQIDAFKAVCAYFVATQRIAKGQPPPGDGPTFGDLVGKGRFGQTEGHA
jgi:hypothetical protein